MVEKARFNLTLTLRDNHGFEQPLSWSIDVDQALRISSRAVDELKMGADLGVGLVSFNETVELIRTKEIRRELFVQIAVQLATQMADRIEDAEGWHDANRIEPARAALGGSWR